MLNMHTRARYTRRGTYLVVEGFMTLSHCSGASHGSGSLRARLARMSSMLFNWEGNGDGWESWGVSARAGLRMCTVGAREGMRHCRAS